MDKATWVLVPVTELGSGHLGRYIAVETQEEHLEGVLCGVNVMHLPKVGVSWTLIVDPNPADDSKWTVISPVHPEDARVRVSVEKHPMFGGES